MWGNVCDRLIWSLSRVKSKTEKLTQSQTWVPEVGVHRWADTFVPVWLRSWGTNQLVCTSAVKQTHVLLVCPPAAPAWTERCHCLRGRRVVLCVYHQTEKNSWDQRSRKNQSYSEATVLVTAWNTPGCCPPGPGEWKWILVLAQVVFILAGMEGSKCASASITSGVITRVWSHQTGPVCVCVNGFFSYCCQHLPFVPHTLLSDLVIFEVSWSVPTDFTDS